MNHPNMQTAPHNHNKHIRFPKQATPTTKSNRHSCKVGFLGLCSVFVFLFSQAAKKTRTDIPPEQEDLKQRRQQWYDVVNHDDDDDDADVVDDDGGDGEDKEDKE